MVVCIGKAPPGSHDLENIEKILQKMAIRVINDDFVTAYIILKMQQVNKMQTSTHNSFIISAASYRL